MAAKLTDKIDVMLIGNCTTNISMHYLGKCIHVALEILVKQAIRLGGAHF